MSKISEIREIVLEYVAEYVDLSDKKLVAKFDELFRVLDLQST